MLCLPGLVAWPVVALAQQVAPPGPRLESPGGNRGVEHSAYSETGLLPAPGASAETDLLEGAVALCVPASSARWVSVTERVNSTHSLAGFSPNARQPSSLKSQRRPRPPARCGAQAFKRTRRKASACSCSAVSMGMPQSRVAVCEWHVAFPSRADVSGRLSNRINFYQIQDQQTDRVVPGRTPHASERTPPMPGITPLLQSKGRVSTCRSLRSPILKQIAVFVDFDIRPECRTRQREGSRQPSPDVQKKAENFV